LTELGSERVKLVSVTIGQQIVRKNEFVILKSFRDHFDHEMTDSARILYSIHHHTSADSVDIYDIQTLCEIYFGQICLSG